MIEMVTVKKDKKGNGYIITKAIETECGTFHQQITLTADDLKSAYYQFLELGNE